MKNSNWVKNKKQFIRVVYLASFTLLLCAFLNNFFLDSILGASIYIGFCFFIAVISFNKKAFKQKETKK